MLLPILASVAINLDLHPFGLMVGATLAASCAGVMRTARVDAVCRSSDGFVLAEADLALRGDPRTYADLVTPAGLAEIATYADAIGPHKGLVIPRGADDRLAAPSSLVADAHAAGLLVHPWTFRSENYFLPADFHAGDPADPAFAAIHGDADAELAAFFAAGVDGVFADFPDVALRVRAALP